MNLLFKATWTFQCIFLLCFFMAETSAEESSRGNMLYKNCVACHGKMGMGNPAEETPKVAGQYDWYILSQLRAYKTKERKSSIMWPYIKDLSDKDFQDLASYMGNLGK